MRRIRGNSKRSQPETFSRGECESKVCLSVPLIFCFFFEFEMRFKKKKGRREVAILSVNTIQVLASSSRIIMLTL